MVWTADGGDSAKGAPSLVLGDEVVGKAKMALVESEHAREEVQ